MSATETLPEWSDNSTPQCERCASHFSFIKRRHHCRKCGMIVCQGCSSYEAVIPDSPYKEPVRVCDGCFLKMSVDSSGSAGKLSPKRAILKPPPVSPIKVEILSEKFSEKSDGCCDNCCCPEKKVDGTETSTCCV